MTATRVRPRPAGQVIRVLLPDTGPLISLALADELELLLRISAQVRLIVTDVVHWEATHRANELVDAEKIALFLQAHADRLEIMPTTIGQLALADLRQREQAGEPVGLPSDLGELSITNAIIAMQTSNPGDPTLVLVEDDWFASHSGAVSGNVHVLSTASFLQGLERIGVIASAAAVRAKILQWRPYYRADFLVDRSAEKIDEGTQWMPAFKPPKK